jgi:type II secretory ATPase GspE/PulE/Tfp pilus assembly ATPase PilB-like protein
MKPPETKKLSSIKDPERLVDACIAQAVDAGASDLFWIPASDRYEVCYRADGRLETAVSIRRDLGAQCVARIKVMASLLTYRTRIAQDGVIRYSRSTPDVEIRVAVIPSLHGERATLRIFRTDSPTLLLDELGFSRNATATLANMLKRPGGLIILTGPTGSGKTTTIYALIRELIRKEEGPATIITLEDPIEVAIEGVTQTAVTTHGDWNYSTALRAALRQDVKTIVIGEMRDREIIETTLDAALSGHRVITTYHAGDIPGVYTRLLHQGMEPFLVASAITGVVSQRLLPLRDGQGLTPAAAVLEPDAAWKSLVMEKPSLTQLRDEIRKYPVADLVHSAKQLAGEGLVAESEFESLRDSLS